VFPSVPEEAEVGGHRADIVRSEHSALFCSQRQNLWIIDGAQSGRMGVEEIERWLPSQESTHNGFIEISGDSPRRNA
jgi:hypothetical protein